MSSSDRDVVEALGALYKSIEEYKDERKEINKKIRTASKEIDKLLASINASEDEAESDWFVVLSFMFLTQQRVKK